jgi:acetyl esterase/lipase
MALVLLSLLGVVAVAVVWWKTQQSTGAGLGIRYAVPQSISPEARAIYEKLAPMVALAAATRHAPRTVEEFAAQHAAAEARAEASNRPLLQKLGVSVAEMQLGGIRLLELRPANYQDDGTLVIYVHGGGFVLGSANSSAGLPAMMARATGRRMLSVDYTIAPQARWPQAIDQVMAAYQALLKDGHSPKSIGIVGESAGGNIAAASVLKLRDQGVELPAAMVLLSPGLDLTMRSDTWTTLAAADPVLSDAASLEAAFELYAPGADRTNPYISPLYGDFGKGYPPVLLQAGTREVVLSDSVRLHRALKAAGIEATLDLYEGMPHVFQGYMRDTPEQKASFEEQRRFWLRHLTPTAR